MQRPVLALDNYDLLRSLNRMSNEKPVISFRIRADIKDGLQKLATADRRSLSQYIQLALEAHIEAVRGKKPKTKG